MKKNAVLIVAGGNGIRMGSTLPKQFLKLAGKPLLFHTIEAFNQCLTRPAIYLVMNEGYLDFWAQLCQEHQYTTAHEVVSGGLSRSESVYQGLKAIHKLNEAENMPDWVAIHDAVRPLIRPEWIDLVFDAAQKGGNAVPVIPLQDSIRLLTDQGSRAVPRENYRIVQTPQVFSYSSLLKGYQEGDKKAFTDDASLMEALGEKINLVEGYPENIKVTYPTDIILAETLLIKRNKF